MPPVMIMMTIMESVEAVKAIIVEIVVKEIVVEAIVVEAIVVETTVVETTPCTANHAQFLIGQFNMFHI
jgi:hypothetical protein